MKKRLATTLFFVLLILALELVLNTPGIIGRVFPKPSLVIKALVENRKWIMDNLWVTLEEALLGSVIAVLLGMILALTCLLFKSVKNIVMPLAVGIRNVPFVAIAPILFMLLGFGQTPKIVIVVIVGFYPILANLLAGFEQVPQNQMERFFLLHASKWQIFSKLQLPCSIPYFISGLEITISTSIIAAIVAELMGSTSGLGHVIRMAISQYQYPLLMATVFVTTIISIAITAIENKLIRITLKRWL